MAEWSVELLNGKETVAYFEELGTATRDEKSVLFRSLGEALVGNVKRRIITSDDGSWRPASKWLRAKSGQSKVLKGAEKYVRYSIAGDVLKILGKPTGKWTLTQHHEGFENELVGDGEEVDDHGRVVLTIRDPRPLGLGRGASLSIRRTNPNIVSRALKTFAFVPQRVARTPARKIWPTGEETEAIARPIASRWLNKLIRERGRGLVHD